MSDGWKALKKTPRCHQKDGSSVDWVSTWDKSTRLLPWSTELCGQTIRVQGRRRKKICGSVLMTGKGRRTGLAIRVQELVFLDGLSRRRYEAQLHHEVLQPNQVRTAAATPTSRKAVALSTVKCIRFLGGRKRVLINLMSSIMIWNDKWLGQTQTQR